MSQLFKADEKSNDFSPFRLWNSILLNLEDDGGAKYDRI